MTSPLTNAVRVSAGLRERLKAEFGLEDGDEALEDTLEGETDLNEQIALVAREALRCEAMAEGMKRLVRDNQERKSRLEVRAEKLRGIIAWALEDSGLRKLPLPDMTISLSDGRPPLIVNDAVLIPDAYCKIKKEPDRTVIRKALDGGEPLDFAHFGNSSPTLTIRTR